MERRRVFSPNSEKKKEPARSEREAERSQLVSKIQAAYTQALPLLLLPPDAAVVSNGGGLCFGLLDPVSNIVVNALSSPSPAAADSQVVVSEKLAVKRSVEALLTFLTCFFPYLEEWEAVRYLLVAGADLVLAVRLVIRDRRLGDYCFADSFKTAIKCAALAAKHGRLVATWSDPSTSFLQELRSEIASICDDGGARRLVAVARLRTKLSSMSPASGSPLQLSSWEEVAANRGHDADHTEEVASTMSLRRALLDKIHGYYLRAMARLPAEYHRSMLHAGHCYGPMDPVSNIVLNAVSSHHLPFSAADDDDSAANKMPRLLLRVGARSLYGLASFLSTRYPGLDFHAALRCLLSAGGHLQGACKEAERRLGHHPHPHGVLLEAYAAAAAGARHPQPDAQATRLTSLSLSLQASSSSSASMEMILKLLPTNNSAAAADTLTPPMRMHSRGSPPSSDSRIHTKVKAALRKYYANLRITADPEIHAICGVNERVLGPDKILSRRTGHPYYSTHVNFLATTHCSNNQQPMLFFAELGNEDDDDKDMVAAACPVAPEQLLPRCLYCDHEGSRIVHPRVHEFHGRDIEFQRMVCNKDLLDPQHKSYRYTNFSIIQRSDYIAERLQDIGDDDLCYIRAICKR